MGWASVIGQERVKEILRQSIRRDRLAHAYLLSGPEGTGKDAVAIELARTALCERRGDEACGACRSCRLSGTFEHPDLHLVFPLPVGKSEKTGDDPLARLTEEEVASVREEIAKKSADPYYPLAVPGANTIKVNSVRRLRKESSLGAFASGRRVFLLLGAERMNDEAANALLKILEEPGPGTLLVLTTAYPDRLLPTILSRCQHLRLTGLAEEDVAAALESRKGMDRQTALTVAKLSGGSYRTALELEGHEIGERREAAVDFLRTALYKSRGDLLAVIERLTANEERAGLREFLASLAVWLREAMVADARADELLSGIDAATVRKFSAHHAGIEYEPVFASIERAISLLSKNVYIPLILLTLALDLRELMTRRPAAERR